MSDLESMFCRTRLWRVYARKAITPKVLRGPIGPQVLEIGCGSGAMAAAVLDDHPEITRYVATDVDPKMIEVAERELSAFGSRAEARVIDATGLPYDDGTFDTVCSWLMLHHTIEWESVVADAVRVLRPGGRFVGYDLDDTAPNRFVHTLTRSTVRMAGLDDLRTHLTSLGLRDVKVSAAGVGAYLFTATA